MKRILINSNCADEIRAALIDNDILLNFDIEFKGENQKKGNIYKGKITKIESSLEAIFVDYGSDKDGFLPFNEISINNCSKVYSSNFLNRGLIKGKNIIVQVEKDEKDEKGVSLTTYLSISGSYLVLLPNNHGEGISKDIDFKNRILIKEKIKNISLPDTMGIIIRTAGIDKSLEDLKWELNILLVQYEFINFCLINNLHSNLIYKEGSLPLKFIKNYLKSDIKDIMIDNINIFCNLYKYLNLIKSHFIYKLKLYCKTLPLFSYNKIEKQIELSFKRQIILPSGGSITIDETEALIAIDVNSSKSNQCFDIKETALQTNIEAAEEIVKQIILRNLSGIIVIDFIDMIDDRSHKLLEKIIEFLISIDKAKVQIGSISKFGILEISRQKLYSSIFDSYKELCFKCNGTGRIYNMDTLSSMIFKSLEEEILENKNVYQINIEMSSDLLKYILTFKKTNLTKIQYKNNFKIVFIAHQRLSILDYKIYKLKSNNI
jgi:ribonuclease E